MNIVYDVAEEPHGLINIVLKVLFDDAIVQSDDTPLPKINANKLCKLLFTAGHIALAENVHLDEVERHWKNSNNSNIDVLCSIYNSNFCVDKGAANSKEELEKISGTADDEFTDLVRNVKEYELFFGSKSGLATIVPVIVNIISESNSWKVSNAIRLFVI